MNNAIKHFEPKFEDAAIKDAIQRLTQTRFPNAETVEEIVQEMLLTTTSERQGRVIDGDNSSMEDKKKDGYF